MTLNGWDEKIVSDFRGRFNRGDVDSVPEGYSIYCENIDFNHRSAFTRPGTVKHLDFAPPSGTVSNILRIRRIQFESDGVVRYLVMYYKGVASTVSIYDSAAGGDIGTLTVPAGQEANMDFNVLMLFDRCYISSYYNTGIAVDIPATIQKVYVYQYGAITSLSVGGGSGFAVGDLLSVTDGRSGKGATFEVASLGAGNRINSITLKTKGSKYNTTVFTTYYAVKVLTGTGDITTNAFNVSIVSLEPIFRIAAGAAPDGFTLVAATGAAGKVEAGRHLFAVAYETDSGFITAPGPDSWTLFNAAGSTKIDISVIPVGPAGTVARHILASKFIFDYNVKNFNQLEHELFFIPNGRIEDNTRVAYTVDFYDSELIASADYLIDQREYIPSGPVFIDYNARMVVGGGYDQGDQYFKRVGAASTTVYDLKDLTYVAFASKQGAPESISSVDGFMNIGPDDAGGQLYSAKEDQGLLFLFKKNRTYVTSDTALNCIDWRIDIVDGGIGALGPDSVSKILDSKGLVLGGLLVVHTSGIRILNGVYQETPLTWNIDTDFDTGLGLNSNNVILVDPVKQKIYCGFGLIASPTVSASGILVGDYQDGLSPDKIKWSFWTHTNAGSSLYFFNSSNNFYLGFAAGITSNKMVSMYFKDTTVVRDASLTADDSLAIASYLSPDLLMFSQDEALCQLSALRAVIKGSGNLNIEIYDRNLTLLVTAPVLALSSTFSSLLRLLNQTKEAFIIRISTTSSGSWFHVNKIVEFGSQIYETRPA